MVYGGMNGVFCICNLILNALHASLSPLDGAVIQTLLSCVTRPAMRQAYCITIALWVNLINFHFALLYSFDCFLSGYIHTVYIYIILFKNSLIYTVYIPMYLFDIVLHNSPFTHGEWTLVIAVRLHSWRCKVTLAWKMNQACLLLYCCIVLLSLPLLTLHHTIRLQRLQNWAGLCGTVIKWFKSYLHGRKTSRVHLGTSLFLLNLFASFRPNSTKLECYLPQLCRWYENLYFTFTEWMWTGYLSNCQAAMSEAEKWSNASVTVWVFV